MDLNLSQKLMARLFTGARFRERVLEDAASVAEEYHLSSENLEWLRNCAREEGRRFARSLIRKRLGVIVNLLPLTRRSVGKQFGELFHEFAADRDTHGVRRHLHDAIDFSGWLLKKHVPSAPDWFQHVVGYERNWLEAQAATGWFFRIRIYRHHISRLHSIHKREEMQYTGPPNLIIWLRRSAKSEPHERRYFPRFWPS